MTVFHIITPCLNAEKWIGETIQSVLSQTAVLSGQAQLHYRIMDGGSQDRTLEIARSFDHPAISISSEADNGMYDALAKGLAGVREGICAYLNAGDLYARTAFEVVTALFETRGIRWLTGLEVAYNEKSQIIRVALPFRFRRRLFEVGAYGSMLPFVQQESTFWDASLLSGIDLEQLRRFRLAGDYYLWRSFAEKESLNIVETHLGGFRVHRGQLSARNLEEYRKEMRAITVRPGAADRLQAYFDKIVWQMPTRVKKIFNRSGLLRYDSPMQRWT